jgi:hypothetical protein
VAPELGRVGVGRGGGTARAEPSAPPPSSFSRRWCGRERQSADVEGRPWRRRRLGGRRHGKGGASGLRYLNLSEDTTPSRRSGSKVFSYPTVTLVCVYGQDDFLLLTVFFIAVLHVSCLWTLLLVRSSLPQTSSASRELVIN